MTLEDKDKLMELINDAYTLCNNLSVLHDDDIESDAFKWSVKAYYKLNEAILMLDEDYWAHEDVDYLKVRERLLTKDKDGN